MDTERKHLTGVRKRQQIAQANKTMFMWVVGAAVLISFSIVALQFMFKQAMFNGEIISAKSLANSTLQQNLDNATDLQNNVNALIGNSDLSAARLNDKQSNLRVILDALPANNDVAAFAASMQQTVLSGSGVFIDGLNVPSDTSSDANEFAPPLLAEPQEQAFSAVIQGNFNQVNNALRDIQRTIRPINIKNMSVQGNDKALRVTIEGITYYQPAKTVNIQKSIIKP